HRVGSRPSDRRILPRQHTVRVAPHRDDRDGDLRAVRGARNRLGGGCIHPGTPGRRGGHDDRVRPLGCGLRHERGVVWDHLRMDPQDDREARIRALEQPLADTARATELGTTPSGSGGNAYLPPPVPPMPPQAPGPDYGAQYTPPGYGAPWAPPPPKNTSAGIPWVVLGIGAAVFMAVAAGVGIYISTKSTRQFPFINMPSISVPSVPSFPSIPAVPSIQPNAPSGGPANTLTPGPQGGQLSVSGMSE